MPSTRLPLFLSACILVGVLCGCGASTTVRTTQTHLRRIEDVRAMEPGSVTDLLRTYRTTGEDEVLYRLERGMLSHYQEQWETSAAQFRHAGRAIDAHYTKDLSQNLESLVVNDLQLPYSGEPYESIYLTTFNCLNYLQMGDREGALVEMRRVNHKLELLNDRNRGVAAALMQRDTVETVVRKVDRKLEDVSLLTDRERVPALRQHSALGRFLTTVLYGKTGQSDEAAIALRTLRTALSDQGRTEYWTALSDAADEQEREATGPLQAWAPIAASPLFSSFSYSVGEPAVDARAPSASASVSVPSPRALTSPTRYNTLLLSFTGHAPRKYERTFEVPIVVNGDVVPLHFAVPVLRTPDSNVERVRALVAGDTVRVPVIEDMQAVAHEMFDQQKPVLYTRAVARAFLKAGLTEGAEAIAREKGGDGMGFLVEQVGHLMSRGAAQADTRGWQTMPGYAHAVPASLPAGTHTVTFEFLSATGRVLKRRTRTVTVDGPDDLALAESVYLE